VDDEPAIRLICQVNLSARGLTVFEAVDGEDALRIAGRERLDMILVDVMMPGVDGFEVVRRLAADERTAMIPVAFLSARGEQADVRRGLELGAVGYFTKPFDPISLAAEVDELLERLKREGSEQVRADARAGQRG
jgi:DNA-binding response OmpR family regulator